MVWSIGKLIEGYRKRVVRNINGKHVVGSSHIDDQLQHNEKSMRYVEAIDPEEFYIPEVFRLQSKDNKQGSCGELPEDINQLVVDAYTLQCNTSYSTYRYILDMQGCREQARGVLVPAVYTSWIWTTSLQALLNFLTLRLGEGAQDEITEYCYAILKSMELIVPVTIKYWKLT